MEGSIACAMEAGYLVRKCSIIKNGIAYFMMNLHLADKSFDRGINPEFPVASIDRCHSEYDKINEAKS